MGLRQVGFVLMVFAAMHFSAASSAASELGCDDTPAGSSASCGVMILNAKSAIAQIQVRAKSTQAKQRRQCAGSKNAKLRKVKNYSARQMKANGCIAAKNGTAATDILRGILELGLLDAKAQCQACNA